MTQEQINELRKLAQDATPGAWVVNGDPLVNEGAPHLMTEDGYAIADFWGSESILGLKGNEQNAAFIAAANPAAVLELIAEVDRLREDADDLTIALESSEKALKDSRANDYTAMGYLADCRMAVGDNGKRMLPEFVEYLRQLKQQRDELLAALKYARELVDDWGAYASNYMQEKHDLAGDLDRLDAHIKGGGTIMTTTAFDDQFTAEPEPVRQPYDTGSILRRNVADLELALKRQTERAEKAEAELAKLREQKPVRWHVRGNYFHDGDAAILFASMNSMCGARVEQLYAAPVPVPHKGATHCDDCGLTWLDDGLNPLGCPYCKDTVPAPAVPSVVFMAHNKTSSILFAARKDADQYAASFGPAAGVSVTECAVIGSQSAPQAPAVPEQKPIWSGWSVWFKGGDGLFPAHFLHDSYGIPLRYPTRFAAAEKIKRHTRDSRELYEPREYSLYDAPQAPAVPEFCAVEAQLTLAETEMLNAKAWSPGTQAKRHIDFAMTAICCARALLQSAEVKK